MPRIDKSGNLEFHPIEMPNEMPNDFESAADPDNPFIRKQFESITTTRACKKCGKRFTLGVPYDPENLGHDLCENCILKNPANNQEYPEKTVQIEQTALDAIPTEYQTEYQEEAQEKERDDEEW